MLAHRGRGDFAKAIKDGTMLSSMLAVTVFFEPPSGFVDCHAVYLYAHMPSFVSRVMTFYRYMKVKRAHLC